MVFRLLAKEYRACTVKREVLMLYVAQIANVLKSVSTSLFDIVLVAVSASGFVAFLFLICLGIVLSESANLDKLRTTVQKNIILRICGNSVRSSFSQLKGNNVNGGAISSCFVLRCPITSMAKGFKE